MARRFSEEEAQRIFARVAERQRAGYGADAGLSMAELEEAARAAGLDPSLVAAAADELDAAPHAERRLAGAPVEVVRSRAVPGALGDEAWARMVAVARREFGESGMAGQVGRLRERTAISGGTKNGVVTRMAAEPTASGTRVTVTRSVREAVKGFSIASAIQLSMSVLFLVLFLAGADPELWIPSLILAVMGAGFGLASQAGARVWHGRTAERFERLLDRLELAARDAAEADALDADAVEPDASVGPRETRLDLDALPDAPDDAAPSAPRSRTRS